MSFSFSTDKSSELDQMVSKTPSISIVYFKFVIYHCLEIIKLT